MQIGQESARSGWAAHRSLTPKLTTLACLARREKTTVRIVCLASTLTNRETLWPRCGT
jgi:hypothetical protein